MSSPSWIVNYNIISGALWSFVLVNTLLVAVLYSGYEVFDLTSTWNTLIQCCAVVEIYNSAVGNVRSPLVTTVMQVASRLLLVIGIFTILPDSPANAHWSYITMITAWAISEIIRYYYYAVNILSEGNPPAILKWLRYNAFLILYPVGISSECTMIYKSLDEAALAVGEWYKWFLIACLAVYVPGSPGFAAGISRRFQSTVPDLTPLKYEQNLYASLRVHNRPYLVTKGDEMILPFRLKNAEVGDVLNFHDVTTIGSRNYTYNLSGSIDPSIFTIKAVVVEKTKKPMYVKEITKRRNRHTRHVKVKHDYTVLRVSELKLNI
ncbi:hypothetical protein KL948_003412 [Ogataea haglerorum]|nr:hypothetical protein KL948_003412 [Ogataea haglerorum]